MQTLRGLEDWAGRRNLDRERFNQATDFHFHLLELQALQHTTPHFLQWWRRFTNVNWTWKDFRFRRKKEGMTKTFLQCMHVPASLSGTHTAACSSTAFFPDLRNRSCSGEVYIYSQKKSPQCICWCEPSTPASLLQLPQKLQRTCPWKFSVYLYLQHSYGIRGSPGT